MVSILTVYYFLLILTLSFYGFSWGLKGLIFFFGVISELSLIINFLIEVNVRGPILIVLLNEIFFYFLIINFTLLFILNESIKKTKMYIRELFSKEQRSLKLRIIILIYFCSYIISLIILFKEFSVYLIFLPGLLSYIPTTVFYKLYLKQAKNDFLSTAIHNNKV